MSTLAAGSSIALTNMISGLYSLFLSLTHSYAHALSLCVSRESVCLSLFLYLFV